MAFRFNPRFKIGPLSFGKKGVSVRTGISGLTYQSKYGQSSSSTDMLPLSNEDKNITVNYDIVDAVISLIIFFVLLKMISFVMGIINVQWYFLVPFFFLWNSISMIIFTYNHATKSEAIRRTDRRFKVGYRLEGFRSIKDKTKKIPFTEESILIRRITGLIKLSLVGMSIWNHYPDIVKKDSLPSTISQTDTTAIIHSKHNKKLRIHKHRKKVQ